MSFGIPVRNGLAVGLLASTFLSSRRAAYPAMFLNFLQPFLDSRVTFSRGSNATLVDSTGKITYAPANLFTNSEFPNGVTDAPTRGGLLTATTFSGLTSGTGLAFGYDGSTATFAYKAGSVNGTTYAISTYVRMDDGGVPVFGSATPAAAGNTFALVLGGNAIDPTTYTVTNMGGGLYRVAATAVAGGTGNSGIIKYSTNNNRTFTVSGYQLEPVTYQTTPGTYNATTSAAYYGPRFDYDPVTLAPKGLLIEEARTNLVTYSAQFDNAAWLKLGATIAANTATSPDGTVSADTLIEDTSTGGHIVYQAASFVSGTTYTTTVFAKAGTRTRLCMINVGGSAIEGYFDLSNGTVISSPVGTASITAAGNGWYRCQMTSTAGSTTSSNVQFRTVISGATSSYTGDGTSGLFLWGAQLEAGAFATSYIPTVASTVTRSADVATMTGTNFSSWYNQTEGTIVADSDTYETSDFKTVWQLWASDPNRIVFRNSLTQHPAVVVAGVVVATLDAGGFTANVPAKSAAAIKANDFASSISGGTVATAGSGALPAALTEFRLGRSNNTEYLNGHIRQIAYYNTRLPNSQLVSLTT